ncbi:MAG: hypothetical protein JWO97_2050 [Acidobacteria bacterium]|jgi:uncharacterized protein YggT (Ycf19 family)|nr:hypothetical protein [Acidobacteriota bacterium]
MPVIFAVENVILIILSIIQWTVFAWVILSWILLIAGQTSFRWRHASAFHILSQIYDMFGRMARPFIRPFQRMLPSYKTGGIDWSPILLFLAIYLLRAVVIWLFSLILAR